ncbi:uncharacterized protein LOC131311332 isoform X2 [Rhododendron vialii]|uniref:uncharacterized protein LOC131311332 isoform X2 n=1 Tax=Rhododendron vialii TaxID=182163 RepID=UPI00265E88C3|nr:uncharacterized protein LOC131311332 isoform X2 [Rhododendron vialii]
MSPDSLFLCRSQTEGTRSPLTSYSSSPSSSSSLIGLAFLFSPIKLNTRYYSEAIDSGATPVPLSSDRTVDVQCVIAIMDYLLACEATWHKGHSLAQTVFPCIYLLKPNRTSPHALLHSYCKLLPRNLRLYIFHQSIRLVCCLVRINPIAAM